MWNSAVDSSEWIVNPSSLLTEKLTDPGNYSRRLLMYPVRFDEKDRLSCVSLFSSLANIGGRLVWVAPEDDSFSIWTNFAFQATHGVKRD